jgi:hypothetical protein
MANLQEAFNALSIYVAALPASKWNKASQDKRDAMVRPVVKKWYAEWRDKMTGDEFNEFKDVWLVRENFHTCSKMLDTIEREEKGILTLAHHDVFSHDEEYVQGLMDADDCDRDTALMYEVQDFETQVHETCKDLYHDITSRNYANMRIEPEWNCHNPDSELVLGFFPGKGWRGDDKLLDKVISMLGEYSMRPVGHDGEVIADYDKAVKFVKDALKA